MLITLPSVLALDELRVGNRIRQIAERTPQVEGALTPFTRDRIQGLLFRSDKDGEETLFILKAARLPANLLRVVKGNIPPQAEAVDLRNGTWLKHPLQSGSRGLIFDYPREIAEVLKSWVGTFSYVQEDISRGIKGLRGPQIGAVHAVHMHWTVADTPATIVMPTGTGKTDTMLSILVSTVCTKVLVVVPTDALRTQIAEKFLTLGTLKEPGSPVLHERAKCPIVGILQHIPRNAAEVDEVFGRCHVIATTSSIAGQCETSVQDRMASHCSHLFIDEAHHAEAPTWSAFKERFKDRRVLQFTATPFREDGRPLDGDIIFKYPLNKAQQAGYFKPIHFRRVVEFNRKRVDEAIAKAAIEQLRTDFDKGHILMARAENVARAKEIFKLYEQYSEFKPVQLHTGIKSPRQRETIRRQVISGESRIVVCVDMLGEGFDLPELKIAAFHDIRKTLAVTLQLAGRFTRSRPDLGDATFIANTADVQVQDELRKLYSRDPDWNLLLPDLSERMIGEQISLQEFLRGFTPVSKDIPLKAVRPAMSTVAYHTKCGNWSPEKFREGVPGINMYEQVHETINHETHTLVVVMGRRLPLLWADVESLFSWNWELYVVIWSPDQNLLFINSSSNSGEYKSVAQAVAGDDVALISGQDVFRTFAGINRLRFQNIGLTEQLGRNIRYTGRMGGDVEPALTDLHRGRGRKSVLSGTGYEGGEFVTVGASRKGRIWSHRRDRVDQLAAWCRTIGAKLLDTTINPDEVVKGTLNVKTVSTRPAKMPIGADWPEDIYTAPETTWSVFIDGEEWPLAELSIELDAPSLDGPLRFAITSETDRAEFELELFEDGDVPNCRFNVRGNRKVEIGSGSGREDAAAFFYQNPPTIWFVDGSALEGNQHAELRNAYPLYDAAKIETLDWTGVDLRKESQGPAKDASSIQARVIRELKGGEYAIIFDDDGKGEVADIVAVRTEGDQTAPTCIEVDLYHCKYSHDDTPGRRIEDLYEVCGQAQKSIAWVASPDKKTDMFTHLLRRESLRQQAGTSSRFEVGDQERLLTLRDMSRLLPINFKIYIVQPGVSKASASPEQLGLLSVTENYLAETHQLRLGVIANN
jgi:superfamily II DNA or RNA helicase